jgi:hypothetical protein
MQYAKTNGSTVLEFPSYPHAEHPQTSFGNEWQGGTVDGVTYVIVETEDNPTTDYLTQDALAQTPVLISGKWIQKITVVQISAAENAKRKDAQETQEAIRNDRFLTQAEIKAIRVLLKGQV